MDQQALNAIKEVVDELCEIDDLNEYRKNNNSKFISNLSLLIGQIDGLNRISPESIKEIQKPLEELLNKHPEIKAYIPEEFRSEETKTTTQQTREDRKIGRKIHMILSRINELNSIDNIIEYRKNNNFKFISNLSMLIGQIDGLNRISPESIKEIQKPLEELLNKHPEIKAYIPEEFRSEETKTTTQQTREDRKIALIIRLILSRINELNSIDNIIEYRKNNNSNFISNLSLLIGQIDRLNRISPESIKEIQKPLEELLNKHPEIKAYIPEEFRSEETKKDVSKFEIYIIDTINFSSNLLSKSFIDIEKTNNAKEQIEFCKSLLEENKTHFSNEQYAHLSALIEQHLIFLNNRLDYIKEEERIWEDDDYTR